jgi:molybdopterin converting factor small subunit
VKIEVLLFAAARQAAGREKLVVELAAGANVGQLRCAILTACPALSGLLPSSLIAINHDYARDDGMIPLGAEVALIPPVSGG